MPASNLRKLWPCSPVVTMSWTVLRRAPALATRKVPGSISSASSRPVRCANCSNASLTGAPTVCKSVDFSPLIRPTLYPPPRLSTRTVGSCSHRPSDRPETRVQTAGSEPEPMCVCTRAGSRSYSSMIAFTSGISSCQMPKEEEGPPTLVLPVPPEPRPGLKRTPSWSPRAPRRSSPKARSWRREHALYLMPMSRSSPRSDASSCELSEMRSGATPAAMARRTSYEEDASMWRPMLSKI
mmetsp:Transcript_34944/g.76885  ORF Transcript_34944/g.76885 Transcript_34944/m.76885 type:complete len:239 (+) Transcript_34944:741-1457(+)